MGGTSYVGRQFHPRHLLPIVEELPGYLKQAIAPLTPEQLALRAAPGLRSVGEIVAHVISSRVHWFGGFLGEMSSMPGVESLLAWDMRDAPPRTADELVEGLDTSWRFMADLLDKWDSADMQHTFPFDVGWSPLR